MNVFVASAFWHLWAHDYWYPEGGLQPWIDRWVARLEERGVRFLWKRTVTALEKRGDRATAVLTHRKERFQASEIVYCGDLRHAVHRLVGAERYGAREIARLDAARHSDAMVSVYLGLDMPRDELRERLKTSHVFFFPTFDCRTAIDPRDPAAHRRAFLEVTAHATPPGRGSSVVGVHATRLSTDGVRAHGRYGLGGRRAACPKEYCQRKRAVAVSSSPPSASARSRPPHRVPRGRRADLGCPVHATPSAAPAVRAQLAQLPLPEPARARVHAARQLPPRRALHRVAGRGPNRCALG
jgi:hypothetical protein